MKASHLSLALALSCLIALPGCATKNDEMEAQLMQHDQQLRRIQPVQADSWNQMQTLRAEVNELKGQIADLRNAGGARFMADKLALHDKALRRIDQSLALRLDLGEPMPEISGSSAQPEPTYASQPQVAPQGAYSVPPSATQTAAASAVAGGAAGAAAAPVATSSTWGQETPRPKPVEAQKDMAVALYEAGVNSYNSRQYEDAQRSFNDFLKNYGSNPKAPNAQFYVGECYFQRNQYADAALAYDTVINKYPKSAKAPAAYLKQGLCFSKLNSKNAARARMNELIKKYPDTPEAQRAKDFLRNNK